MALVYECDRAARLGCRILIAPSLSHGVEDASDRTFLETIQEVTDLYLVITFLLPWPIRDSTS